MHPEFVQLMSVRLDSFHLSFRSMTIHYEYDEKPDIVLKLLLPHSTPSLTPTTARDIASTGSLAGDPHTS